MKSKGRLSLGDCKIQKAELYRKFVFDYDERDAYNGEDQQNNQEENYDKYQDPITGAHFKYEDMCLRLFSIQQQLENQGSNNAADEEAKKNQNRGDEIKQNVNIKLSVLNKKAEKPKTQSNKKIRNIHMNFGGLGSYKSIKKSIEKELKSVQKEKLNIKDWLQKEHFQSMQRVDSQPSCLSNNWILKSLDKQGKTICVKGITSKFNKPKQSVPNLEGGKFFSSL